MASAKALLSKNPHRKSKVLTSGRSPSKQGDRFDLHHIYRDCWAIPAHADPRGAHQDVWQQFQRCQLIQNLITRWVQPGSRNSALNFDSP